MYNLHKSVDCEVGEWTSWDKCLEDCTIDKSRRLRQIITSPANGGKKCPDLFELKDCQMKECPDPMTCDLSQWTSWSACSAECGGGTSYR